MSANYLGLRPAAMTDGWFLFMQAIPESKIPLYQKTRMTGTKSWLTWYCTCSFFMAASTLASTNGWTSSVKCCWQQKQTKQSVSWLVLSAHLLYVYKNHSLTQSSSCPRWHIRLKRTPVMLVCSPSDDIFPNQATIFHFPFYCPPLCFLWTSQPMPSICCALGSAICHPEHFVPVSLCCRLCVVIPRSSRD